jgi:FkbM family methyltransferase
MADQEHSPFTMTPEAFTEAVYRSFLGRSPDPEGLANCTRVIRATGDHTLVLQGILASPEFASRNDAAHVDCSDMIAQALARVNRRLRVVDVGAQTLGSDSHPYHALLTTCDVEVIGFDPLEERLHERALAEPSPHLTLLPYAIADGETYTWYVNNDDSTSSLFPLNETGNAQFNNLSILQTARTEEIKTHRLDDVLPAGPVDMLKLDVQGAELLVLIGAARTLPLTSVVHCEVSFSAMYLGQALFPQIYDHLAARGFALVDLLLPGRYHYLTPSGCTTKDKLIWGDAIFFRETDVPEVQSVQALIAATVYQKRSLAEHLLVRSIQDPTGSPFEKSEINGRLSTSDEVEDAPGMNRMRMTVSCRDTESIPKVPGAGEIVTAPSGIRCQRMHNGTYVVAGGYHGSWMSEIIKRLRGHHEPQEELLFHSVVRSLGTADSAPLMIELGAFWSYYSLWFRSVYRSGRSILVEPDENNIRIGQQNFELNGLEGEFFQAAVGDHGAAVNFLSETDGIARPLKSISVDGLVREMKLDRIDLLHADIQGAELSMLNGIEETVASNRLNWLFLSTHHHSISGDPLTHQKCVQWLTKHKALIVAEHSVAESFSGDGLIVAKFGEKPAFEVPKITRNAPADSLFRETEYDLSEAWDEIRRLRSLVNPH